MAPFGRQRPPGPTEAERQAAEIDLERIRQGGIPLGAEERLKRLSTASTPFFTSDLSTKEFALAEASGLQPIAQVMGSSVVRHGWVSQGGFYATTGEVPGLSEPWNLSRRRAFGRMAQEAELAGADGVIGIEMNAGNLGDPGNVELVVFGTAVRDTAFRRGAHDPLGMCTLSGQEVDKLRRIGAAACGVVGHTTVLCVQLSMNSNWMLNSSGIFGGMGAMNAEVPELSRAVYETRRRAMAEVRRQAGEVRANNIVISTLRHTIEHREFESAGYGRVNYFYVTMNILGTAIRLGAHRPHPTPLPEPVLSINLGK